MTVQLPIILLKQNKNLVSVQLLFANTKSLIHSSAMYEVKGNLSGCNGGFLWISDINHTLKVLIP